jgi:predicted HTH domain antitoxin
MNLQIHLTDERLLRRQTPEEVTQALTTGLILLAYLKADISLGEVAELMKMTYLEATHWLAQLGIPTLRNISPELEEFTQDNMLKFMQQYRPVRGK